MGLRWPVVVSPVAPKTTLLSIDSSGKCVTKDILSQRSFAKDHRGRWPSGMTQASIRNGKMKKQRDLECPSPGMELLAKYI